MPRNLVSRLIRDRRPRRRVFASLLLFFSACVLPVSTEGQVKPIRRVLILYEIGLSSPSVSVLDQGIRSVLENSPFQIELYREYLETTLFPDPGAQQDIREGYLHKYRDRKPDLIIVLGISPLKFVADMHERAFRDVPVVFGGTSAEQASSPNLGSQFTGVWDTLEPEKTLDVALRLQPGTSHVVVVGGKDAFDLELEAWFHQQLRSYESSLDFRYITDLPMPQLLDTLRHLPPHTVVLMSHIGLDAAGTRFVGASQADPMVVQASNAPVFGPSDVDLGHGEVGGYLDSFASQGRNIGEMATRILKGGSPKDMPVVKGSNVYMFDWRALRRWGFSESDLPPGSIVLNRTPGFWEMYERYVVMAIFLFVAQIMAILGLLWQRARRRKTETELRRSEEKFSKSFRQSPLAISITRTDQDLYLEVNETFEELTGWKRNEVEGRSPLDVGLWETPDERSDFLKKLHTQGNVQDFEVRIRRKDGQIRATLGSAELIEVQGEPCALSVFTDITERKLAEDALANVSHKLIEAQEQERTRIARELHDDINQRIALAAIELDQLQQNSGLGIRRSINDVKRRVLEIGVDVQAISHRLHSSKLEYLGVVVACSSFCTEVAERQEVTVDYKTENMPAAVPQDVSLCLFRVLQESLNNAIKHSGAKHFEVQLRGTSGEIQLTVRDHGGGFDVEAAMGNHGLGLISMRERASLVKGKVLISSQPMGGTEIILRIPLAASSTSQAASGAA